jgi:hypothetical protein
MGLSDEEPDNDEDAEQAANMTSEQNEYAKFLSELTNKNLDEMEYEVQNELRTLNEQNKKDRALADDITQQMAKDIQVRLPFSQIRPHVMLTVQCSNRPCSRCWDCHTSSHPWKRKRSVPSSYIGS